MISVIIPNLHSPIIDQVVGAIKRQTARERIREIIVVGQDRYRRVPPGVTFLATPRPLPAAAARNQGARAASGAILLFLDSDCIAAPDLVERLLEDYARGHTVVGGGVALEPGAYWALCDNLLVFAPFLSTAPTGPRRYLPSLNLSLTRELFQAVGGFDERFPGAAGEDIDLCLRLSERGQTLFFDPRAIVHHRHRRMSAQAVWAHLRAFGRVHVALRRDYGGRAAPRLSARLRPLSGAIMAGAPLLALRDVIGIYRTAPALRPYWRALPGMTWGKLAWYWGVAEALLATPRSEESH